jgi:hypothetical protein
MYVTFSNLAAARKFALKDLRIGSNSFPMQISNKFPLLLTKVNFESFKEDIKKMADRNKRTNAESIQPLIPTSFVRVNCLTAIITEKGTETFSAYNDKINKERLELEEQLLKDQPMEVEPSISKEVTEDTDSVTIHNDEDLD